MEAKSTCSNGERMRVLPETFRVDSILLTTIGGAAIGCLVQCADYHTIAHGPMRAFLIAGIAAGITGFVGGCAGEQLVLQSAGESITPRSQGGSTMSSLSSVLQRSCQSSRWLKQNRKTKKFEQAGWRRPLVTLRPSYATLEPRT